MEYFLCPSANRSGPYSKCLWNPFEGPFCFCEGFMHLLSRGGHFPTKRSIFFYELPYKSPWHVILHAVISKCHRVQIRVHSSQSVETCKSFFFHSSFFITQGYDRKLGNAGTDLLDYAKGLWFAFLKMIKCIVSLIWAESPTLTCLMCQVFKSGTSNT